MGRYTQYFQDIWKMQANRKAIGLTLFGVILDNTKPFTPGNQLTVPEDVQLAVQTMSQKGYDFVIVAGQPPSRTKNLDQQDFDNILNSVKEMFVAWGATVKSAYYAPGVDRSDPYVKPNTGMFERAQSEGHVTWEGAYYIGADANDVKAAAKVKSIPVLITSAVKPIKTKAFELTHQVKVQEFGCLLEFAKSL